MAITYVSSTTSSVANGTSISISRPASYASGDVFVAVFTSNSQDCTPPSGWTELFDEPNDVFRCQVFYKVTGGSEASSYSFSVPAAAPLVGSISCFRGVDTANPIDVAANIDSGAGRSEPATAPSLSGGSAGRTFHLRAVRVSGSTPATFTASGVTEVVDTGIFSGGSVCYSFGLYISTADYIGTPPASPSITASQTESHNILASFSLKSSGVPGSMDVTLPLPTMTASGSWAYAATMDADLPLPVMASEAFSGDYSGALVVDVPIEVDVAGSMEPRGSVEIVIPIDAELAGETRSFGDNSIIWEREERWFVLTQEGYYLGRRVGTDLPMRVTLPELVVTFFGTTSPLGPTVDVGVEAFDATTTGVVAIPVDLVTAAVSADPPGQILHIDPTSALVVANDATVASASMAPAEHVSVAVEAIAADFIQADPASVSIVANDSTVSAASGVNALAGHAFVSATNYIRNALAEHVSVTAGMWPAEGEEDDLMRYSQSIGNGTNTSYTVTHNFGSRDVIVGVYDSTTFEVVEPMITHTTTNAVTLDFASAPATNAYRVVVLYSQS